MRAGGGSSRAMATGLIIVLLAVSAGINFVGSNDGDNGGFGLVLSFARVLAGVNTINVGVQLADDAAAPSIGPVAGARALAAFLLRRRNLAFVGLVMVSSSSSASTAAVAGETTDLSFCFGMLVLLLLGLSLMYIGVLGA